MDTTNNTMADDLALLREAYDFAQFADLPKSVHAALVRVINNATPDIDGERFRFMLKAFGNPDGPEAQAMNRFSEEHSDDDPRPETELMLEVVDKARALFAEPKGEQVKLKGFLEIPLNEETRQILGRPCFQCIGIANGLRKLGHEIAHSAEDEQAAVIHFLLNLYLKHGDRWADEGDKILKGNGADNEKA